MKLRYSRSDLPAGGTGCSVQHCIYNTWGGWCYTPNICKGNSDAICHRWSNKKLLETLGLLPDKNEIEATTTINIGD